MSDPEVRQLVQEKFAKWFRASLRIFGRAGTPGNRYCLEVGLKTRDSGEVAAAFVDSIRPVMRQCQLSFPDPAELGLEIPSAVDLRV